jgi:uncharacterized protein involved in response to NO
VIVIEALAYIAFVVVVAAFLLTAIQEWRKRQ